MRRQGLILAVWALWAHAAVAQTTGQDQPYKRTHVRDQEVCLYLADRRFVYSPDAAGSARTPGDTEFAAMDAAFDTWQAVSNLCSDITYVKGARVDNPSVGYDDVNRANNLNVITFREVACRDVVPPDDPCQVDGSCGNAYRCWDHDEFIIAQTLTSYSTKTGAIYDADIELNAAPHSDGSSFLFTAVNSPVCPFDAPAPDCVATDIQNTLTHEIGHAMGLDHATVPGSTMEATAPPGETRKRIIDSGTAQGFCEIYPRAQPATSCEGTNLLHQQIIAVGSSSGCAHAPGAAASLAPAALLMLALGRRWKRPRR